MNLFIQSLNNLLSAYYREAIGWRLSVRAWGHKDELDAGPASGEPGAQQRLTSKQITIIQCRMKRTEV